MHKIFRRIGLVSSFAAEDHKHIFSLEELKSACQQAGFRIIEARTFKLGFNQFVVCEKP